MGWMIESRLFGLRGGGRRKMQFKFRDAASRELEEPRDSSNRALESDGFRQPTGTLLPTPVIPSRTKELRVVYRGSYPSMIISSSFLSEVLPTKACLLT